MSAGQPIYEAKIDGSVPKDNVRFARLYLTGAVSAGNPVCVDPADSTYGLGKSFKKNVTDDNPACVGIATETITAAGFCRVQVAGPIQATDSWNPVAQGAVAVNSMIGGNNSTTAGTIKQAGSVSATVWPFALCLKAYTSTNADGAMYIIDKGIV